MVLLFLRILRKTKTALAHQNANDPETMCRALGDELRQIAAAIMQGEFGTPYDFGQDSAYIEFVGTAKHAQGKGVASANTKHIIGSTPYKRLVLEVADTNTAAIRLYAKLGFSEFKRVTEPIVKPPKAEPPLLFSLSSPKQTDPKTG